MELEEYLEKYFLDASFLDAEKRNGIFSVKIEDNLGVEKLSSIKQMNTSLFADSTSSVDVEFELPYRDDGIKARVRLNFSRKKMYAKLYISAVMPNSREFVLGLRNGLLRLLESQKIWHWIAHPVPQVGGALFVAACILGYIAINFADKKENFYSLWIFLIALIWFYLFFMGDLRPYNVFKSRASDRSDKIWGWLIGGAATFLLFGTLLTLFRRPLLGF
ncbi:hypothetical protein [Azohydromonas caseinilytica]|uniref:Uncharacterized protein n=1 Tax=Azohydromonas caseinilytica TaxID=2728836 RepID=A0A848FL58_9BURK|nr:hypothetical protein [Azohydromonas caseinilytica]NML19069.1 hypothetical protein [Azohydromonas caseinilytica]